jgi:hypothetical protein
MHHHHHHQHQHQHQHHHRCALFFAVNLSAFKYRSSPDPSRVACSLVKRSRWLAGLDPARRTVTICDSTYACTDRDARTQPRPWPDLIQFIHFCCITTTLYTVLPFLYRKLGASGGVCPSDGAKHKQLPPQHTTAPYARAPIALPFHSTCVTIKKKFAPPPFHFPPPSLREKLVLTCGIV